MTIASNVSALQSNQIYMNNNANNVANVNSDGYIPTRTTIQENGSGSPTAVSSQATDTGATQSQTDLNKELTDQVILKNVNEANVAAIKTQDQMTGTLLDIKA